MKRLFFFVNNNNVTQEVFDSKFSTLQKRFNGAKLRLNTKKTEFMSIKWKNSMVFDIQMPMGSKFLDNVKFWFLF